MPRMNHARPDPFVFDDASVESVVYDVQPAGPSDASVFVGSSDHVNAIVTAFTNWQLTYALELLASYLYGVQAVPLWAFDRFMNQLGAVVPNVPRPLVPEPVMNQVHLAHEMIRQLERYESKRLCFAAKTLAYRWHEARGEFAEARKIIAPMLRQRRQAGEDSSTGILTNNLAYEYQLEGSYAKAKRWFERALRAFERTDSEFEIANAKVNILTCRFELEAPERWLSMLPELRRVHGVLVRYHDWRARKSARLLARLAQKRGRLSAAIGWARRALDASSSAPTQLQDDDQKLLASLELLRRRDRAVAPAVPDAPQEMKPVQVPLIVSEPEHTEDHDAQFLFGLETEYAFTAIGHGGDALDRTRYCSELVALATHHFPFIFGRDSCDLFLANGGRLYVDQGCGLINMEYATPECTSPRELIAHIRAGDLMLSRLAQELEGADADVREVFVSKCNFDYLGTTSGSHENYAHTSTQSRLAKQLIPHLVSRIVYTGGGGFDHRTPYIQFMLSPRVSFLEHARSDGAQSRRGIFTTKNEPLSNSRYSRLQLLCSEGVRYDTTEYLRFGVTALLIRLTDLGVNFAKGISLNPLYAINVVARDVSCRKIIGRIDGKPATAIDIQRHYLGTVEQHVHRFAMPGWVQEICHHWATTLDQLATDPSSSILSGALDWPTKLRLFREFVRQWGGDWAVLTDPKCHAPDKIRQALYELDIRLGDISEQGLFASMQGEQRSGGDLSIDRGAVEKALQSPPKGSRAAFRGDWIRLFSKRIQGKSCNWDGISGSKGKLVRFDDPFGRDCR